MYYLGKTHQKRFEYAMKKNQDKCTGGYLAALYLFCADRDLNLITGSIVRAKVIKFSNCKLPDLTIEQYAFFRAAQDIYTGSAYIGLQDLGDCYSVSDRAFDAILEAMRIARRGYSYIGIEKKICTDYR